MTRIVVLSGVTAVDDPWHDFAATSQAVASCLNESGWQCTVATTVESGCAGLADADLLIVNSGVRSEPGLGGVASPQLLDYLASPRAILGLHAAANTFAGVSQWAQRLGVRWIEGFSMHPPIGWQRLVPTPATHALHGLDEVVVYDELYCNLDVALPADVLLAHHFDSKDQPLVLARADGPQRTIYDALGHDVASYSSRSRRELLRREVSWLLGSG